MFAYNCPMVEGASLLPSLRFVETRCHPTLPVLRLLYKSEKEPMMKPQNLFTWIFACVPLLLVLVMLPTLPDIVPAHYGFDGNVDRLGSKYEYLIPPLITIAFQFFFLWISKHAAQNAKTLFWCNIAATLSFLVLTVWLLSKV
jgi:hypothetical protein